MPFLVQVVLLEVTLDLLNSDYGDILKTEVFDVIDYFKNNALNKILSGYGKKIGEEGFDIG